MARNKFLKRMAVTALAASMTFGTVPAVAMNVFADQKVTSENPSSTDENVTALYTAFSNEVSKLDTSSISTKSTADDIQKALVAALKKDGTKTYSVSVENITTETAKYENGGVVAPTISAEASIKEYENSTTGDQDHPVNASATLDSVTFTLNCGEYTDADKAAVAADYYTQGLEETATKPGFTFKDANSVSAAPVQDKLNKLKTAAPSGSELEKILNAVTIGKITTEIKSQPTDDNEGTVTVTVPLTSKTTTGEGSTATTTTATENAVATVYISRTTTAATIDDAKKVLADTTLTNQQFTVTNGKITGFAPNAQPSALESLKTALTDAGIKTTDVTVYDVNVVNGTAATHAANGTAKLVVTLKAGSTTDKDTYTFAIEHSLADIKTEATNAVKTAIDNLKATDFQAAGATIAPTQEEVEKVVTDAIDKALADKLGGNTTIASELYAEKPYKVTVPYKAATKDAEGSVDITVQLYRTHEALSKTDSAKYEDCGNAYKRTISTPALKTKNATGIDLGDDIDARGSATITPDLTPDGANTAYVKLAWKGATKLDKAIVKVNGTQKIDATVNGKSNVITLSAGDKIQIVNGDGKDWKDIEGTLTATLYDARNNKLGTDSVEVTLSKLYSDVTNDKAFYFDPVYELASKKYDKVKYVVTGTSASTFSPEQNVTRGDFITLLYRATKAYDKHFLKNFVAGNAEDASEKFTDVSSKDYYAKAIAWAVDNGIANGTSDSTFSPSQTITRADAVTFIARLADQKTTIGDDYTIQKFDDVKSGAYYANAVNWASEKNITAGKTSNTFAPNDKVTRGQAATFIYRYFTSTKK